MRVITCLVTMHDPFLLVLASLLCVLGSWVSVGMFVRFHSSETSRGTWLSLSGLSAGATTWCTHFVAMLAFDPGGQGTFDVFLTTESLLVAVGGSAVAVALAGSRATRARVVAGGAALGASISAMHYVGMLAYANQGIVEWDSAYVVASVACSMAFGIAALHFCFRRTGMKASALSTLCLVAAIVSLHFIGMGALVIDQGLEIALSSGSHDITFFAIAIAGVGAAIVGSAFSANLLDARNSRETADNMKRIAMTDLLTQLPNRAHFTARLTAEIEAAGKAGRRLAVYGIDLDHFKEINDLRGHAAGDHALRAVASRMAAVLEPGEFLARLGGDEFAAVKPVMDGYDPAEMAGRLRSSIVQPISLPDGSETVVDGCFGITVYPQDGKSAEVLIGNADLAMYRAKGMPSSFSVLYSPEMDDAVRARRQLVSDLRLALAAEQFEIHYQVQENVATNEVTGYEALLRWRHPERGLVHPMSFIPAAEETGMIIPIGEWVLRQACRDASSRPEMHRVAVNLSAVQFAHPDLPGMISGILAGTGLEPARLEIELTESALMTDPARNMEILRRVQELGVSIAMDDFGTGYSSLSTLRSFRFDKIKLDRSFMPEVDTDPQAKAIIRAVLALGQSLHIPVLAEGVETAEQLAFLRDEGCNEAQGYLIGRPGRLADAEGEGWRGDLAA